MPKADIAILTVIPEEYAAVINCLSACGCKTDHDPGSLTAPNQFGWVAGKLESAGEQIFRIVVGIVIQPGPGRMASAVSATYARYRPNYVLIVGIAGGFPQDGLMKGDVVVSSVIYDYDYGKIATEFQPRMDFTYQPDQTLLTSAISLHTRDGSWAVMDNNIRPDGCDAAPKLLAGAVASGGKVVDHANNDFFAMVLKAWPRLVAVEMEGAGAAAAIETAKAAKQNVGFIMVRGISDMPKTLKDAQPTAASAEGNKAERDKWKKYAAATAARFTIHWIRQAWPLAPRPARGAGPSANVDDGAFRRATEQVNIVEAAGNSNIVAVRLEPAGSDNWVRFIGDKYKQNSEFSVTARFHLIIGNMPVTLLSFEVRYFAKGCSSLAREPVLHINGETMNFTVDWDHLLRPRPFAPGETPLFEYARAFWPPLTVMCAVDCEFGDIEVRLGYRAGNELNTAACVFQLRPGGKMLAVSHIRDVPQVSDACLANLLKQGRLTKDLFDALMIYRPEDRYRAAHSDNTSRDYLGILDIHRNQLRTLVGKPELQFIKSG